MDGRRCCSTRRPRGGALVLLLLASATVMTACGGGVYFAFWDCDGCDDDGAPNVSLAVSPERASAGQAVTLTAAASDDTGIDGVVFFRLEGGSTSTRLAQDCCSPYQWVTLLPDTASGSVSYFARAVDFAGNVADSNAVAVTVLP